MSAPQPADKIMFEIFLEQPGADVYSVVYFTELDEHSRETEISRAMRGEHVFDGFLRASERDAGKAAIKSLLTRLNSGSRLQGDEIRRELAPYLDS